MASDFIDQYRARLDLLEELKEALEAEVHEVLANVDHIDRIYFRVKEPDSFVKKATDPGNDPAYEDPLAEIEDQVAGRIMVFFTRDIPIVQERLQGTFTLVERRYRRPDRDEEFGYECHHLICVIPPHLKPAGWDARDDVPDSFELQIRTLFMHAYAEPQHDIAYKGPGDLPSNVKKELAWIAASAWGADMAYVRVWDWHLNRDESET